MLLADVVKRPVDSSIEKGEERLGRVAMRITASLLSVAVVHRMMPALEPLGDLAIRLYLIGHERNVRR
ncbi:MAG TPA: hypothetical protein VJZ71_11090 [Phycisphaerae bacterium]|nr:hypothetical protein [Phycisphaerae bacterium]